VFEAVKDSVKVFEDINVRAIEGNCTSQEVLQ
jgi:hypothetical protein